VQTEEVLDVVLQTEEPVCAEEVHSPREALGRVVPSDSDAKRTKRMSVIIGVEPTPVEPKPTTK
jgi:hypothetical protein